MRGARALKAVLPAVAGGVIGGGVALLAFSTVEMPPVTPAALLLLVPVLWLVLAVHEAAHLAGGALSGFRPFLFACGPVLLLREGERFRLRFNNIPAYWGGIAGCTPDNVRDLRRGTLRLVAAGPAVSLVAGAAALAAGALLPGMPDVLRFAVVTFGLSSVAIGLVTLVPGTTAGHLTDGARILLLLRNGPDAERDVANMTLFGLSLSGVRPRDWDPALVMAAIGEHDGSTFELLGHYQAMAHHVDADRPDAARPHLERLMQQLRGLPPTTQSAVLLDAAWFAAWYDRDADAARALLARVRPGPMIPAWQQDVVRAAVALAEADVACVPEYVARARTALEHVPARLRAPADERISALEHACRPLQDTARAS